MPKINLIKSTHIDAPVEKVFEAICDFNHWPSWSPWLIMNPDAKLDIANDAKSYSWEGNRVGSGHMSIISEVENKTVHYDLTFLKPWKSTAKVKFEIEPSNGGTQVAWHMDSSLPFFMFWMKKMMVAFVGMDYERGLALLKDYVEDGEVHSKLNFIGNEHYTGCSYLGIRSKVNLSDIGSAMQADFEKLWNQLGDLGLEHKNSFSIYHKFDPVKNKAEYTAGISISSIPETLPDGIISGEIPAGRMYTLEHVGPYEQLGNAWTTLHNMIRGKEIKVVKGIHPWETYHNNPNDTEPNDLITQIHFMVK